MNIYQAALKLREDYAHTGIELEATEDAYTNLYFVMHDALHTYLGCPPELDSEPQVLATELVLGGQEHNFNINPNVIADGLASIPSEVLEVYIDFYTAWFSR